MPSLSGFSRLALVGALGVLLLPGVAPAAQEGKQNLKQAVAELAKSVKAVVEKEGQPSVRVGNFVGSGLDDSNAGTGISALLAQELGDVVNPKAILEVQGTYAFIPDRDNPEIKVIRIRARLVDTQADEVKKEFLGIIGANPDIAKLLNITGPLDPDGSREKRNKEIQVRKDKPSVHIHGEGKTLISSKKDSPYSVELLCKPLKDHEKHKAEPRKAAEDDGKAFVQIDKGELYEVRILNHSDQEIGVTLTIDGIDAFQFSEDRKDDKKDGPPRFTHWIIAPAKDGKPGELTVPGWHKTIDDKRKDNYLSFLVTEYGKGAASKFPTKSQGKVGVITVSFACSFPEGTARSGGETGFGPPREVKQKAVKRVIDPPHDFVSVRYLR